MTDKTRLGQYAGFGSRLAAYLLDLLIISGLRGGVSWAIIGFMGIFGIDVTSCQPIPISGFSDFLCLGSIVFLAFFNLTIALIYYTFFWILAGQTIGKYALGLRIVRLDGKRMNFRRALVRYLSYFVSMAPLALGFFWILVDNRRQGWHDKLARTCVVYAWQGGFDGRALSKLDRWVDQRFNLQPPGSELMQEES